MNLPNMITMARLLSVPIIIWLILDGLMKEASLIFILAAISDALDGILARALKIKTTLGAYLDPLADKALLIAVYLTLAHEGFIPLWIAIAVTFRDILIIMGTLLLVVLNKPFQIAPLKISKLNTAAQLTYVSWVLAHASFPLLFIWQVDFSFIICVAFTTLLSGVAYVRVWSQHVSTSDVPVNQRTQK
ncbi:MAG: CDP-alcohol phosphatidyltransferase family protein [bacterium]|nr:CDP-alcohol phosphatidyltransferase family protein [bacterium]